jgi:hypothetical protein
MRRPDFFFVGHPRSGSGLLDSFLKGHPDLFMARKELHYFGADLRYHDPARGLENYLAHFEGAGDEARVGEASTWYLISERAAQEIRQFAGENVRILMMLRDPVSWLASLHSHLCFTGDEDIQDFAQALAAEPERRRGERLPPYSIPACATWYRHHTDYATQVSRYFEAFGRERVKVLVLDDMRDNSESVLDDVLRFLDVRVDFEGKADVLAAGQRARNSNRTVRSRRIRHVVNTPRNRRVLEGVDPAPVPGVGMLIRALRRGNIVYTDRKRTDPALAAQLRAELQPRVEALEALLDRDLSAWKPKVA